MITIDYAGTDEQLIRALREKAEEIPLAVAAKLDELDAEMQGYIVSEELAGQILNQRSGKLAGSIRMIPATAEGTTIIGQVQGGGGVTGIGNGKSYAELFEYGESVDIVPVKAKALRFVTITGEVVYAKKVHLELPRPFMAPGLAHMRPSIITGVEEAISEVLAK
jgi:hypothetical protein